MDIMRSDHATLIVGGRLIDGTGAPSVEMDVGFDGARITGIHKPGTAKGSMTIDATGSIVCPGFIDIHTHSDISLLACPLAESKIRQGVTTEVVGNCGGSAAPLIGLAKETMTDFAADFSVDVDWVTMDEYLLRLQNLRTSVNVATFVGADTLRSGVIGADDVAPTDSQLEEMKELVAEAIVQGAFGLSSGLIYAPGCYATTEELIALASTSGALGGIYASHIRGEGSTLLKSVAEAITIGREARLPVQISHHKATGKESWGLVAESIRMVEDARSQGIDVAFDVYPYTVSCTNLSAILPPWVMDGGKSAILDRLADPEARARIKGDFSGRDVAWENTVGENSWENIEVGGFKKPGNKCYNHMRVSDIASKMGKDAPDAVFDLLIDEGLDITAFFHEMSEDDVVRVIKHPLSSIASDGEVSAPYGPLADIAEHPRAYGTFPRAIRRYVIDEHVVSIEEMIRKMTSSPAQRLGITDRGMISEGMMADVVVFDPLTIRDKATLAHAHQYSEGITDVFVNGTLTIQDGEHLKERAGMVLRKPPVIS
jgi:N-acyl-D-amino-acid deacylase